MALFTFWHDTATSARPADQLHRLLDVDAHIVATCRTRQRFETACGVWHLAAHATTTHFYPACAQVWIDAAGGACVIHGLIWRMAGSGPARLLGAREVAELLDRPGQTLPTDVGGEYAVARLHRDGSLTAFSDHAGLHQIFHGPADRPVVTNRARSIATLLDDARPDPAGQRWLPAIGYRVGTATAYRSATQLAQGQLLRLAPGRMVTASLENPIVDMSGERGWSAATDSGLDEGIAQAQAALLIGVPADGPIDLPITGGKDSRAVLALALASGLRDRLRLFTRGYAGHPDVVAGAAIAAALGISHRREAPHGSDEPAHWTVERFFAKLSAQTFQTDGMVGGWDLILGDRLGAETIVSGHVGEVLKAYSKRPVEAGLLDPVAMVRLQAPFDPMALLLPEARDEMVGELADAMARERAAGAGEADLPDLFYFRNRLPNWLGAIRGIKSFERQPVVPLGAPALVRLAFRLTPEERKRELLHFKIIERCAPELLPLPFAQQRWDAALEGAPCTDPIVAGPGAPPLFGNWQYSLNHNAAIRAALAAQIAANDGLALWSSIDRDALLARLHNRRLDYFDGISMLGAVTAFLHEAGLIRPLRLGACDDATQPTEPPGAALRSWAPPTIFGHLDSIEEGDEDLLFGGWAHSSDWPAAQIAVEAKVDGKRVAITVADRERPDLVPHGMGDGRHGFALAVPRAAVRDEDEVVIGSFDSDAVIARLTVGA